MPSKSKRPEPTFSSPDTDLAYWEEQASRLERDARRLRLVPVLCWLTAIGVALARAPINIPIALVVLGVAIAAIGAYMITVRRQECSEGLQDARRRLHETQPQP